MSDTVVARRPVPRPTRLSRPFWDACREGRLLAQQCGDCGGYVFLPQEFCSHCLGVDLEWVECVGSGTIVTLTVIGRAQTPAFETPYVVAVVRLHEGYEMLTNIVDAGPDQVRLGAAVEVSFVPVDAEITLPCFSLVG